MNRVLCEHHGVNIAGVIVNKVKLNKYEQTQEYMSKAFQNMWGVPLLGVSRNVVNVVYRGIIQQTSSFVVLPYWSFH